MSSKQGLIFYMDNVRRWVVKILPDVEGWRAVWRDGNRTEGLTDAQKELMETDLLIRGYTVEVYNG